MNWHRSGKFFSVLAIFVLVLTALPIVSAQGTQATKIEKAVLETLGSKGTADFVVVFAEQADLSPAFKMGWTERGNFVYNTLKQTASRTQAQARDYVSSRGLAFQTFIAGNEMYVWAGDLQSVNRLAALPEVGLIRAPRAVTIDPVIVDETAPAPQATTDWGIIDTKADQFWSTFNIQGDGIVVANIDTGVQWTHPALQAAYKCNGGAHTDCWLDPDGTYTQPTDNNGHGTHTMGTMVANDDQALTYIAGMAPDAQWIACQGCDTSSCDDVDLLACADWILSPGGSPANRPNIVNNSWGGPGCDSWYLSKVQSWVAAGIFPAFSAGNDSTCGTLGTPGVYQESFGTTGHNSVRGHYGSMGPAPTTPPCDPYIPYTKPNISGPAVNVCSTVPGNGWSCGYTGTSMASPHTAGAVALLWSCNPSLVGQIDQTFNILQNNADPPPAGSCGAPPAPYGGNYTSGYGFLNVLAAGVAVCGGVSTGHVAGHVYESGTTNPIAGATVSAVPGVAGAGSDALTDPTGYYSMTLVVGTYDVTASKVGYTSQTINGVVVSTDTVTTQDLELVYQGQWSLGPTMCFDLMRIDAEYFSPTQKVYILGGRVDGTTTVGNIYAFDPAAGTCVDTGAVMPTPISNYTVNLVNDGTNDLLCTFGGRNAAGNQTLDVQCYNPIANTAAVKTTLPAAWTNYGPGAQAVVDNQVYIFGGFNPNAAPYMTARSDRYDPVANTFTQLGDLNLARSYILAAVVDGQIYAFGGDTFDGASLIAQTTAEVMADPAGAGTWNDAAVTDLPIAGDEGRGFGFDSGSPYPYAGQIVLATMAQWSGASADVVLYDVASDTYNVDFPDLLNARRNHGGALVPLCTEDPADGLPGMWVFGGYLTGDAPPFAPAEFYPLPCAVAPVADFDWDEPVCQGQPTQFHDLTTGTPTAWEWTFSDGYSYDIQNPLHTFLDVGDFLVTLTATNGMGADTVSHTVTVNPLPAASFTYIPTSGMVPLTVYFDSTSQDAISPTWNFGDGSPLVAGDQVSHTYDVGGTYVVTLTVDSPWGCGVDTATARVVANQLDPAFVSNSPVCLGETTLFTDTSTAYPAITAWHWSFGDSGTSTLQNPAHDYTSAGSFPVTLVVTNSATSASITGTATVDPLPLAEFTYTPTQGMIPLTVYFTNASQNAISPTWEFGNGEVASGDVVSYTYDLVGTYVVTLTVQSPCGPAMITHRVVVEPFVGPPIAEFVAVPQSGYVSLTVQFTDTSMANPPITSWQWNFDDSQTSTETNPLHTYMAAGTYSVVLTVANDEGSDSVTHTVTVFPLPQASFDYGPSVGLLPLTVYFTNTSVNAISPTWNFGDASPLAIGEHVSHTYNLTGTFTVVLTVTSPFGPRYDTVMHPVETGRACEGVAITSVVTTVNACAVTFSADLTGDEPFIYLWQFGDGATSSQIAPMHAYTQTGTYAATLYVWNCAQPDPVTYPFSVTVKCGEAPTYYIYLPLITRNTAR